MDNKICARCGESIPQERKRSAVYCSDFCFYEVKKLRSIANYWRDAEILKIRRSNSEILTSLFGQSTTDEVNIPIEILSQMGFDFGYADTEKLDENKETWKLIDGLAYKFNKNKTISICNTHFHQ